MSKLYVFSNGESISGVIGKTPATRITYNGKEYIGFAISTQGGILYLDGETTNIPDKDQNVQVDVVKIYVVDGKTTKYVVNQSDVQSSTTYYTNNNQLTNIEVSNEHQIVSNTVKNDTSNITTEQIYTIKTIDDKTYTANNIEQTNDGFVVKDINENVIVSGNNISTTNKTVLYHIDGRKLGLNENAIYSIKETKTVGSILSLKFSQNACLSFKTNITVQNNCYLPKYNGAYFVVDGKLMQNDLEGNTQHVNVSKSDYKAVQQPVYVDSTTTGRWSDYSNHQNVKTDFGSQKFTEYSDFDSVLLLPNCFGIKNQVHCMQCGNGLLSGRTDSAGSDQWRGIALSIANGNLYDFNNQLIDSSVNWKQVQFLGNNQFIALNNNGELYYVVKSTSTVGWSMQQLNNTTLFKTISFYRGGSNIGYGVSQDGFLYLLLVQSNNDAVNVQTIKLLDLQSRNSNNFKIVTGETICGVFNQQNNKVYVVSHLENVVAHTYSSSDTFNIRDIGVSRDEVLIVGYQNIVEYSSVQINGVNYNIDQVTTKNEVVYTVDGVATDKIYDDSHVKQNQIVYSFKDLNTNKNQTVSATTQVKDIDYKCVATTKSGSVAVIVTTSSDSQNNKTYYINGINTEIPFDVNVALDVECRQVYYIGDVNTNVTVTPNDDLQLRGDYWTINGYNTKVRFYGLGQMTVQVSDVTPGELDQNEQATSSTVVIPLSIKAQIVRFNQQRPITNIKLQMKKASDSDWRTLKELTNNKKKLQTKKLEAIFGRWVNVEVEKNQSFLLRCNISDGTQSTVTASALQPQQGNIFYWAFIRSNQSRPY